MGKMPEPIQVLYELHKGSVAGLEEQGYSNEEAFWFGFAVTCLYIWDKNAKITVKLSEILRLYLTIYFEEINKEIAIEEEAEFMRLLKRKHCEIRKAVLEEDESLKSSRTLGQIVHGDKLNIIKQSLTAEGIMSFSTSTVPMPFKLINDL